MVADGPGVFSIGDVRTTQRSGAARAVGTSHQAGHDRRRPIVKLEKLNKPIRAACVTRDHGAHLVTFTRE